MSCGPGLASGCPWKQNAGRSVLASPWREPSKSDTWVGRAVVAELHLQRLRPRGEAHQLVAEADAEHREARRVEDLADRLDRVVARLGVARTVREKHAVRLEPENFPCGEGGGDYGNARAAGAQHAQDVVLDAVIAGDHVEAPRIPSLVALSELPAAFGPLVGLLRRHDLREVH